MISLTTMNAFITTRALTMAILTVRNLEDSIKEKLRIVAAEHGQSMEEEVRQILKRALINENRDKGLATQINQHFAKVGGVSLQLRNRSLPRSAPDFSDAAETNE
jgi:plasmid stability protein